MSAERVIIDGLAVRFGSRNILSGVSLTLRPGETIAVVGASGSGKTTLLRALLGLADVAPGIVAGSIRIIDRTGKVHSPYDGYPGPGNRLERAFATIRGDILGYVPQNAQAALDPLQTVGAQVRGAAMLGRETSDPLPWLERAGLQDASQVARLYPHELSGGMAQRVVIAQALARGSRFLLADEPTSRLDATTAQRVLEEFRRLASAGIGVLLVTHDLRVAARIAEEILVMDAGQVAEVAPATALARGTMRSEAGQRLVQATRRIALGELA